MKKLIILLILIISQVGYCANEIRAFDAGATTCYSVIREVDGDVWYVVGQVFEVWGTAGRDADDYDIALTNKTGGMFVGNFDTNIGAGYYYIVSHYDSDATPDDADPAIWMEYGYWDTSIWTKTSVTAATIADSVWDEAMSGHQTETTFGGELQTLDPNIAEILQDTSAYDTDAEHASAIWDAAMSSYQTETTFGGELQTLDPNITLILADTNEVESDWKDGGRLDNLLDAVKLFTDMLVVVDTTVADVNDANDFQITDGETTDDAYWGMIVSVQDADDSHWETRRIYEYRSTKWIYVDEPFSFTPAVADVVRISGLSYGGFIDEIYEYIKAFPVMPIYIDDR